MKSAAGYRLGIINPLSLVGQEVKTILHQRGIPYAHIDLLDSTGENEGALTEIAEEAVFVAPVTAEALEDLDIVFFCGPPSANGPWIERHDQDRFLAIDLTQPSSVESEGIPIVAGVNLEQISESTGLIVSPHPVATPLLLILDAVRAHCPVSLCTASVTQPASELGQAGVDELYKQTIGVLNIQSYSRDVFDRQVAFSSYPPAGAAEIERYVVSQIHSILGKNLPVTISLTQGTMFHGHTFSIFIQTTEETTEKELWEALAKSSALDLVHGDGSFTAIDAAGKDQILIGRATADVNIPGGFWIWAAVDNLRRGSALNAVLIAEEVMSRFGQAVN